MGDCMKMPETFEEFIEQFSFIDKKGVYTNQSESISVFRVMQAWEHYKIEVYKDGYNDGYADCANDIECK